ncbi:MAG: MAP7 domain-containing protein [Halobacteria archaeon]
MSLKTKSAIAGAFESFTKSLELYRQYKIEEARREQEAAMQKIQLALRAAEMRQQRELAEAGMRQQRELDEAERNLRERMANKQFASEAEKLNLEREKWKWTTSREEKLDASKEYSRQYVIDTINGKIPMDLANFIHHANNAGFDMSLINSFIGVIANNIVNGMNISSAPGSGTQSQQIGQPLIQSQQIDQPLIQSQQIGSSLTRPYSRSIIEHYAEQYRKGMEKQDIDIATAKANLENVNINNQLIKRNIDLSNQAVNTALETISYYKSKYGDKPQFKLAESLVLRNGGMSKEEVELILNVVDEEDRKTFVSGYLDSIGVKEPLRKPIFLYLTNKKLFDELGFMPEEAFNLIYGKLINALKTSLGEEFANLSKASIMSGMSVGDMVGAVISFYDATNRVKMTRMSMEAEIARLRTTNAKPMNPLETFSEIYNYQEKAVDELLKGITNVGISYGIWNMGANGVLILNSKIPEERLNLFKESMFRLISDTSVEWPVNVRRLSFHLRTLFPNMNMEQMVAMLRAEVDKRKGKPENIVVEFNPMSFFNTAPTMEPQPGTGETPGFSITPGMTTGSQPETGGTTVLPYNIGEVRNRLLANLNTKEVRDRIISDVRNVILSNINKVSINDEFIRNTLKGVVGRTIGEWLSNNVGEDAFNEEFANNVRSAIITSDDYYDLMSELFKMSKDYYKSLHPSGVSKKKNKVPRVSIPPQPPTGRIGGYSTFGSPRYE